MKRSKKVKSVSLLLAAAVLMVLGIAAIAYAARVTPDTMPFPGGDPPAGCYRIESPSTGYYERGGASIDIVITGNSLSFDSDTPIDKVYVKGGVATQDDVNVYDYTGLGYDVYTDSGLTTPNVQGISHVDFCLGEEETTTTLGEETSTTLGEETTTTLGEETSTTLGEETTTTLGEETSTTQGDVTTVTKIDTGAGGSTGLGTGTWALGILALALAGGLGWTALRPALKKTK